MRLPFKRQLQQLKIKIYVSTQSRKKVITSESRQSQLDIVSIAFNNELVIRYQIKLLRKYLTDNFVYTVIDNSSDCIKQENIAQICFENGVNYVKEKLIL